MDLSFENEDLVVSIGTILAHRRSHFAIESVDTASEALPQANISDSSQLLEDWYARWGFEGTRWFLIVLTITLGRTFYGVQFLRPSFECLLTSPNCYIE